MTPEGLNVLGLFSGIGGLELGLERAGMTTVGQVEIDPYCRRVLAKHWPEVPRHDDVRTAVEWWRSEPRPRIHVVCGGFPCQPFSISGAQFGVGDERWGWPWFAAVVREVRPRYVVVENVPALAGDSIALDEDYDGFVLHTSSTALPMVHHMAEELGIRYRTMAWAKPFAAFKRNVPVAYAWEPVLVKDVRKPVVNGFTVMRDFIIEPITMRRGLAGAKPERVCHWAFEVVGALPGDELLDLYPGSGAVSRAWQTWRDRRPLPIFESGDPA